MTLADLRSPEAAGSDCENQILPVRSKRRADRGFRIVARDLKRSTGEERMKRRPKLSVDTSASKTPSDFEQSLSERTASDATRQAQIPNSSPVRVEETSFGKATPNTRRKMLMGNYFYKSTADCAMAAHVLIIYVFQPGIVRMAFSTLECDYVCTGSFLHRDLHEPCWEGGHLVAVFLVALPTLLVYALLIPGCSLVFLYRNRSIIFDNRKVVFRYGMIYSGFRGSRWWWDGITLLRKFVMILVVTFSRQWSRQLHLALGIQVVSLHIQHVGMPYKDDEIGKRLHNTEIMSLITLLLMTWVAVFFTVTDCPDNDSLCNGFALVIGATNILFVVWFLHEM